MTAAQQKDLEEDADDRQFPQRHTDATAAVIAQLQSSLDRKSRAPSSPPRPDR